MNFFSLNKYREGVGFLFLLRRCQSRDLGTTGYGESGTSAVIAIRVRPIVVQIQIEDAIVRAIVPIAATAGHRMINPTPVGLF